MGIEAASYSMLVYCDHPDAKEWTKCGFMVDVCGVGGSIQTHAEALRELHRYGWWTRGQYAICPYHKPTARKKSPEVGA